MNKLRLILLIADPSLQRTPAFDRARRLALAARAPLHVQFLVRSAAIAAAGLLSREGAELARGAFVEQSRHWLQAEAEALRAGGIETTYDVQWSSNPTHDADAVIARLQPDLVVKDAEPDMALCGLGRGAQRHLLRTCATPILLVRGESCASLRKVAAAIDTHRMGVDASALNEAIFNAASTLAAGDSAELHLLQVDPAEVSPAAVDNLATFAQSRRIPAEHCHRLAGTTARALLEFIERNGIDLLVLGGGASHALPWASVAGQINRLASCDVLTLNSAAHAAWLSEDRPSSATSGAFPLAQAT